MAGNRNLKAKFEKSKRQINELAHMEFSKAQYITNGKPVSRDDCAVKYVNKGPRMLRDEPLVMGAIVKVREHVTGEWASRTHKGRRILRAV